jgi:hypothetical protein
MRSACLKRAIAVASQLLDDRSLMSAPPPNDIAMLAVPSAARFDTDQGANRIGEVYYLLVGYRPLREDDDGNTDRDGPHWRQSLSFQPK